MAFSSAARDNGDSAQRGGNDEATAAAGAPLSTHGATSYNVTALGLLHDDKIGSHAVESKDIAILRRLKLAILEGQHPYFKAHVDLSNLQDLVLASGSRSTGPSAHHSSALDPTEAQSFGHPRKNIPTALDDLGSSGPTTLDYGNEDGKGVLEVSSEKSLQPSTPGARLEDVNMAMLDTSEQSEPVGGNDSPESPSSENQRPSAQTLGRYVLHSPIQSESGSQATHGRKPSNTPTLVDSNDQNTESEVHVKCESPPYQFSGSPTQVEPPSSSITSFNSNSTVSTEITSEDGGGPENALDVDADLVGYNPKYGNKADYIRRQKVRSKAIESIDEKSRRTGYRPDDKPAQKSPVHSVDHGARRGSGPVSPVRGRNPPSRTHTLNSMSELRTGSRRTPSVDALPPPNFQTSPRGRLPPPSFRPTSPTPGTYPASRRPGDISPTRDYRQYVSYDDPRSARPRPIVSSPPRGSPPHEPPAPRIIDLDIDNYCMMYRPETRSYEAFGVNNDSNWSRGLTHAPPPPPPSRNSPPRARTPYDSTTLPAHPNAGYRPQSLPEPPNGRYNSYDPPRRADWPSNDWDSGNRPTDPKPKLQDRFTVDSSWSRDSLEPRPLDGYASRALRDGFAPHPSDDYASRYRREPSPTTPRYADGFRSGFSRPPDVEGIRPMKRSRPDDGYAPRNGPGVSQDDDLDGRTGTYYRRKFGSRDDEYEPRPRPY